MWRRKRTRGAGCRATFRSLSQGDHTIESKLFRLGETDWLVVSCVKVGVVCIVVRLLWLRVFACEGVLLSESSVVTCESRPLYLSLSLRAWDCVASARRGLPPGRKIYVTLDVVLVAF